MCRLYLANADIDVLFAARLAKFVSEVEVEVVPLDGYPDPAALALADMAFNLGTAGLLRKFPKFVNAFRAKDWHVCAQECERHGIQQSRNEWTRAVFESLDTSTSIPPAA